jgi:hypothetical protein
MRREGGRGGSVGDEVNGGGKTSEEEGMLVESMLMVIDVI